MQNPGGQAGASRNQLGGWLLPSLTATDRQAQLVAGHLVLSLPLARDVALFCALERGRMTERPFPHQRAAALALLSGNFRLSRKAGQFLGQLAVDASPMSEAQADWLGKLLDRNGLPLLATGGSQ